MTAKMVSITPHEFCNHLKRWNSVFVTYGDQDISKDIPHLRGTVDFIGFATLRVNIVDEGSRDFSYGSCKLAVSEDGYTLRASSPTTMLMLEVPYVEGA